MSSLINQTVEAPKKIINEARAKPISFVAGFGVGLVANDAARKNSTTAQNLYTIPGTPVSVTVGDIVEAIVGGAVMYAGTRIPVVGMMGTAFGAGVLTSVLYNKAVQAFPQLPTYRSAQVVPFQQQPFSQAFYGGSNFGSFTGEMHFG